MTACTIYSLIGETTRHLIAFFNGFDSHRLVARPHMNHVNTPGLPRP